MPVDDLWYLKTKTSDGRRAPSRRHGRGKRWRVRYTDDAGVDVAKLFDRRADADQYDVAARSDVARGLYIDPTSARETVAQFGQRWLATRSNLQPNTQQRLERTFRLHIIPTLGALPLYQVKRSTVQTWVNRLDMQPSTVRVNYAVLATLMRSAVHDRALAVSPCVDIAMPALSPRDEAILSPAQVHAIAAAVPGWMRAAVYLGAGCGLRFGEVFGLERRHVDLEAREVHVEQQLVTNALGTYVAAPKTATSRRTVELPAWTAAALREHFAVDGRLRTIVVDDRTNRRAVVARPAELLFTSARHLAIRRNSGARALRGAAATVESCPPATFHALRHYFATLLIFNGASVKSVQMALGHATPTITLNTYVGLWPDQLDQTRSLVDEALGTPPT